MKWFNTKSKPKTETTTEKPAARSWETDLSDDVLKQIAGGRAMLDDCHQMCKR